MVKSNKKPKITRELPAKPERPAKSTKPTKSAKPNKDRMKNMSFFERMAYKRRLRADKRARQHAAMLASLPKKQPARFFAHFKPSRVFHYWFSAYGFHVFLKFICACFLIGIITVGGLFLYYKKSLEDIQLGNLVISETVNTYLDRNGVVLWEDTGNEDYRLVVDGSDISTYMRQATVAIEDKNFYNHIGVDPVALIRAVFSTLSGRGVQGGSTLTQQLIKQVYFSDEAASANRGGITRKIKELILSLELERMYDKEQIITMYLNESPYGGRRNGVESAAQTYFGKTAKELTLAESALLAGVPNNPAVLNPYNEYGHEGLIARQHKVLDSMASLGYISTEEAEEAKSIDILATVKPESTQYSNIRAPHFVLEVKSQLEDKYGYSTMRAGGFTIKTTLDYRAQEIAEEAVALGSEYMARNNSDDLAIVSVDVETSQVIAMVGSIDFYKEGYGEVNAAVDSLIEPGSTIKPILDYAPLFMQREGINYGPGSILKDENINSIYCAGYTGTCALNNVTNRFYGNVSIRFSLGHSLNIAAVKALYINGIENSLETAHALGDISYCANGETAGLSMAIGSGCNVRLVEHANAYASLARGGAYKDLAYILEVKNSSGDILESWSDSPAKQVVDPQVAYMLADILSDKSARWYNTEGFVIPGVWTATKTGTTTTANSAETKDTLMVSYSTALVSVVWNGNHDGSKLTRSDHDVTRWTTYEYMRRVHPDVYEPEGKWHSGDQPVKPAGIQTLTVNGVKDIWPSWFNAKKNSGTEDVTLEFNKYTGALASACTIDSYKISVDATKTIDPMTKKEVYNIPDGYDKETSDDCSYIHTYPTVTASVLSDGTISVTAKNGSASSRIQSYTVTVDGKSVENGEINSATFRPSYKVKTGDKSVSISVVDSYGDTVVTNLDVRGLSFETHEKPEKNSE